MITDLLKGNYKNVLDHILVRYPLASNFDLSTKYLDHLKGSSRELAFSSPEAESLYHLKAFFNHFWHESLPDPLSAEEYYNKFKENISIAAIKDT